MTAEVAILLHAHVPGLQLWRARHPQGPRVLRALVAAMRDVYLPLLRLLSDWGEAHPHGPPLLTLALSPSLVEAWDSAELRDAFEAQTQADLEALRAELSQRPEGPQHELAASTLRRVEALRDDLRGYQHDLASAFAAHTRAGRLALIPSAPTEAPLPLMATELVRQAHICAARAWFDRRFEGAAGDGFWLPGLAYDASVARSLRAQGVAWTVADALAWRAEGASPAALWTPAQPVEGLAVFPNHPESERLPYPLDPEEPAWRDPSGAEPLGAWPRPAWMAQPASGALSASRQHLYQPARAVAQAKKQARAATLRWKDLARETSHERPLLTVAWSLERFGGGWFEGPVFLRALLHEIEQDPQLALTTPSGWLAQGGAPTAGPLGASSASPDGYFGAWLDDSHAWQRGQTRRLERQLVALWGDPHQPPDPDAPLDPRRQGRRAAEVLRLLMLAQSGDHALLHASGLEGGLDLARQRLERAQALLAAADEPQADPTALLLRDLPTEQWFPTSL
jgi:predicted glycosyl hydrolase (DUF1957 family)